ncbi:MAG: hypothetical protein KGY76_07180 [Candidatus Thermoplasmatota archaeon]|nr:hypothetical protein [Candidatus Thermoplasmatota archaeon]
MMTEECIGQRSRDECTLIEKEEFYAYLANKTFPPRAGSKGVEKPSE